jgi:ABC-type uncharacterized transport system involved in gliding motility auxiliary subunit
VFVSGDRQKYVNSNEMAEYDYQRGPQGQISRKVRSFNAEEAFLNALLNVTETEQLRICFTQGHGEPGIESAEPLGYRYAVETLKRENFQVEPVKKIEKRVPRRCDVVVVAGAQVAFSDREAASLSAYLDDGGKLLYAAATAEGVGSAVRFVHSGLEELLASHGVVVEDAFALDLSIRAAQNPLIWIPEKTWGDHPITKVMEGKRMVLEMPRVIRAKKKGTNKEMKVTELLSTTTGKHAWGERDLGFIMDPRATPSYQQGVDLASPVPVAVAAREKQKGGARIVAFGSFINFANAHINPNVPMQDFSVDLLLNSINWLGHKEQMISLRPRTPEQVKLELRADQISRIFRVTVFAMPLAAILLGLLVWWVRRG